MDLRKFQLLTKCSFCCHCCCAEKGKLIARAWSGLYNLTKFKANTSHIQISPLKQSCGSQNKLFIANECKPKDAAI